ncbi:hypothetical protein P167DRAFT_540443 [Morchella conica CCBAS932]|uniref:Uncharacterized protein n=1 Tax=Morchella conica CCBAS932 TaxID=1392247 RepID=A0A3N4K8Z8_9PEZI|nr:hypothetical protein P167DRAFT_540443 [Morchella conica CCBAS932]
MYQFFFVSRLANTNHDTATDRKTSLAPTICNSSGLKGLELRFNKHNMVGPRHSAHHIFGTPIHIHTFIHRSIVDLLNPSLTFHCYVPPPMKAHHSVARVLKTTSNPYIIYLICGIPAYIVLFRT